MLEFSILGPLQLRRQGRLLSLGGLRQRALLAYLLLHANELVPGDQVIEEVWGSAPPASAQSMLRVYVSKLRKLMGEASERDGVLITRPPGYLLSVASEQIDARRFERFIDEGKQALGDDEAARAAELVREALRLWRGEPLADLAYEPFAQLERARLSELHRAALGTRIEADLRLGRHDDVIAELEALVAQDPLREAWRRQLILALYRAGRHPEALAAYREARSALVEELGIEPSRSLRLLEQAILRQDPALEPPANGRPPAPPALDRPQPAAARRTMLVAALLAAAATGALLLVRGGSGARAVAPVPGNSVALLDPHTRKLVGRIPVGARPARVAVGRGAVWVANIEDKTISRIDPGRRVVVRTIPVAATPDAIAAGPKAVWVAHALPRSLSRVDPTYNRVARTISGLGGAGAIMSGTWDSAGVTVTGRAVWVAFGNTTLVRVSPRTDRPVIRLHAGVNPADVAVGNGSVWVANAGDDTVSRFSSRTNGLVATITVGRGPSALAIGAGAVWVADAWDNAVSRIDPGDDSATSIPVGRRPSDVAVGAGAVWVANAGDGTVSRIDPRTRSVQTIRIGNRPSGIAVGDGEVWVTVDPA